MDNITHSLIGFTLAKSVKTKDRAALWTSVAASNLPDFDLVLKPPGGGKLGYLLHHRGYTHTFLAIPLIAVAAMLLGAAIGRVPLRTEWKRLLGLSLLATFLHLGADAWNDYGIHPFAPFWNRWFYGDFIFIIEPLILLALLPFAILKSETRGGRGAAWAIGAALLGLGWFGPFMTWPVALFVTAWAAFAFLLARKIQNPAPAWAMSVLALLLFAGASSVARARVEAAVTVPLTGLVSTPAPGDPLCWKVIAVTADAHHYSARMGVVSLWPAVIDPARCYWRVGGERTAQLRPISGGAPDLMWVGEFRGELLELRGLLSAREGTGACRLAALLRFARVPFWGRSEAGPVAGDLRYDHEKGLGFAEIELNSSEPCPDSVPPWEPPSGILL